MNGGAPHNCRSPLVSGGGRLGLGTKSLENQRSFKGLIGSSPPHRWCCSWLWARMASAATGASALSPIYSSSRSRIPSSSQQLLAIRRLSSASAIAAPLIVALHSRSAGLRSTTSPVLVRCVGGGAHGKGTFFGSKKQSLVLNGDLVSSAVNSLFTLAASLAISLSVFVVDVGAASGFVTSAPRKLQSDELATVRLFEDNTPSVVYITNLAVRCAAYLLVGMNL